MDERIKIKSDIRLQLDILYYKLTLTRNMTLNEMRWVYAQIIKLTEEEFIKLGRGYLSETDIEKSKALQSMTDFDREYMTEILSMYTSKELERLKELSVLVFQTDIIDDINVITELLKHDKKIHMEVK